MKRGVCLCMCTQWRTWQSIWLGLSSLHHILIFWCTQLCPWFEKVWGINCLAQVFSDFVEDYEARIRFWFCPCRVYCWYTMPGMHFHLSFISILILLLFIYLKFCCFDIVSLVFFRYCLPSLFTLSIYVQWGDHFAFCRTRRVKLYVVKMASLWFIQMGLALYLKTWLWNVQRIFLKGIAWCMEISRFISFSWFLHCQPLKYLTLCCF